MWNKMTERPFRLIPWSCDKIFIYFFLCIRSLPGNEFFSRSFKKVIIGNQRRKLLILNYSYLKQKKRVLNEIGTDWKYHLTDSSTIIGTYKNRRECPKVLYSLFNLIGAIQCRSQLQIAVESLIKYKQSHNPWISTSLERKSLFSFVSTWHRSISPQNISI